MYRIYRKQTIYDVVLFLIGLFLLPADFMIVLPLIVDDVSNQKNWILFVCLILIGAIVLRMGSSMFFYYKTVKRLKKENPALVCEYEKEFEAAEKIGDDIWISQHYYFLRAAELKVIRFSEVKNIRVYNVHQKALVLYYFDLMTDGGAIAVLAGTKAADKDSVMACAKKMASLSSATIKSDIS